MRRNALTLRLKTVAPASLTNPNEIPMNPVQRTIRFHTEGCWTMAGKKWAMDDLEQRIMQRRNG